MELLSALLGLEQMEPFCSLPTGHFLLLPQRSIVALHRAASSRELPLLPLRVLEPNPCFPPLPGLADVSPWARGCSPPVPGPSSSTPALSTSASIPALLLGALSSGTAPGKGFTSCLKMPGRRISLSRSPLAISKYFPG